jgi:hypothetical protein
MNRREMMQRSAAAAMLSPLALQASPKPEPVKGEAQHICEHEMWDLRHIKIIADRRTLSICHSTLSLVFDKTGGTAVGYGGMIIGEEADICDLFQPQPRSESQKPAVTAQISLLRFDDLLLKDVHIKGVPPVDVTSWFRTATPTRLIGIGAVTYTGIVWGRGKRKHRWWPHWAPSV